ncbi:hydroxymethylglutaryl-CoA lyase [Salinibacterium sp. ZJ450]|uniref:hydroxymethylglutaryl-CoA lyase n=1 Tax=Salinibacterium sp. ZJ450 TaxID=2708338 RepID=UPI001421B723|nr:hydroxymethylglutaryl-CoA lyase [Salinibacterium sp. ZJ450]
MTAVSIVEVGPRDGLQNEPRIAPTSAKVDLIARLVAAGATRIEVASFVHPRLVPAMADAEDVMARVERNPAVRYIGLALNERGARRAIDAGVDEVNFAIPTTEAFAMANQNTTREHLLSELELIGAATADAGIALSVTIAVAFGCPFTGRVDPENVGAMAAAVQQRAEIDELAIADTIGCGVPSQVRQLFALKEVRAARRLRAHFHETRHTAIANAFAALDTGVEALDSSVGGLGGCPFAPGAAGNVATEDLVWALESAGVTTGIDAEAATAAGRMICDVIGVGPRSGLAHAGVFPPLHPAAVPKQQVHPGC